MDKDKIIQSLLRMLQNSNTEKINMQLTIDDLTTQLNSNKEEDKKDEKQDIRTIQTKKSN
jgi:hypothetical protein